MSLQLKKILPMEWNYEIKNFPKRFQRKTLDMNNIGSKPRFFFLDSASYNNLGDQAIAHAMSIFLQKEFPNREYVEVSERDFLRNFKYLKSVITDKDIICMSGGGNMGNLYPKYEAIRRKVIKNFPDNRIVIFPQTLDYETDAYGKKEMERSAEVYSQHKKLTVCAREEKSFRAMSALYNDVVLVPDIVMYLNGCLKKEKDARENKVGICLRSDRESILGEDIKNEFVQEIKTQYSDISILTTMDGNYNEIDRKLRWRLIKNKLMAFANCKVVVTDRLHGMIFCIITGTPCVAIDNSNQKVSGVFNLVKESVKNVYVLNKPTKEILVAAVNEMFIKEPEISDVGKELYNSLIERLL